MSDNTPVFSVLIPVGPHPSELLRLRDLFESLFHFESHVAEIVLIEDVRPGRDFSSLPLPAGCKLVVLPNPRNGIGSGWGGGLSVGILAGLAWLAEHSRADFILKMDTDALVIAPFAEKVRAEFAAHPGVALLGTYSKTPNRPYGLPEDYSTAPALRKLQRPLTVWRRTWNRWPRLQCTLFGRDRRRAKIIRGAIARGYVPGLHCQGGAYALSGAALKQLADGGLLKDPLLWVWTPCGEDISVTMTVYSHGFTARDFNSDGQPFGIMARGLPDTLERCVERGFSLIHSVKDFEEWNEAATRAFFHERRHTPTPR